MTIERTFQGWRLSAMVNGERISRHYIGYTKREAFAVFRAILEEETK